MRTKSQILEQVADIRTMYRNSAISEDEQRNMLRPLQAELLEVKRHEKFYQRMHSIIIG